MFEAAKFTMREDGWPVTPQMVQSGERRLRTFVQLLKRLISIN
jgi:hypothetical protein